MKRRYSTPQCDDGCFRYNSVTNKNVTIALAYFHVIDCLLTYLHMPCRSSKEFGYLFYGIRALNAWKMREDFRGANAVK